MTQPFRARVGALVHGLRARLGELWWYAALAFVVSRMGDLINLYIGAYLVPRVLSQDHLGAVLPLTAVGAFFSAPLGILLIPVGKFMNVFNARGEPGKVRALLIDSIAVSAVFTVAMAGYMLWKGDGLLLRLQVSDRRLLVPVIAFALLSCVDPVVGSATRALKLFRPMLLGGLVGPYIRLGGMLCLLDPLGALGYLLAQLGVAVWGTGLSLWASIRALRDMGRRVSYLCHWREMWAYTWPLIAMAVAGRIQGPVEALVIRHRLPTVDSAGYYFAVMLGSIPGYFTGALLPFLWPILSDRFERGQATEGLLRQSMLFNLVLGIGFVGLFALIMPWFFSLPGPWRPYGAYAGFVWQAALIGVLKTAQIFYTSHEMACRRFLYMWYLIPLILFECALLYLLPGWAGLRSYLPTVIWSWVAVRYQPSLQGFVTIILLANAAFTAGMLIEWVVRVRRDQLEGKRQQTTERAGIT